MPTTLTISGTLSPDATGTFPLVQTGVEFGSGVQYDSGAGSYPRVQVGLLGIAYYYIRYFADAGEFAGGTPGGEWRTFDATSPPDAGTGINWVPEAGTTGTPVLTLNPESSPTMSALPITPAGGGNVSPAAPGASTAEGTGNASPTAPGASTAGGAGNASPTAPGASTAGGAGNASPTAPGASTAGGTGNASPTAPGASTAGGTGNASPTAPGGSTAQGAGSAGPVTAAIAGGTPDLSAETLAESGESEGKPAYESADEDALILWTTALDTLYGGGVWAIFDEDELLWVSRADVATPDLVPAGAYNAGTNPNGWQAINAAGVPVVTLTSTNPAAPGASTPGGSGNQSPAAPSGIPGR